jgi:hypothetical protein
MKDLDIPIHDIKPLVEIQDYSFYYFLAICIISFLLVIGFMYLIYHFFKNKNRFNIRKEHFELLNNVDFSDAKRAAYDITYFGSTFKDDSPRHVVAFEDLIKKLENYKYKKDVEKLDSETIHFIELYRGMIDV